MPAIPFKKGMLVEIIKLDEMDVGAIEVGMVLPLDKFYTGDVWTVKLPEAIDGDDNWPVHLYQIRPYEEGIDENDI